MAAEYIKITTTTYHGGRTNTALLQIQDARANLKDLKSQMDKMVDAGDYALVEINFGLAAGKGSLFYNLVSGALADMDGSDATDIFQFTSRVGPGV